MPLLLPRNRKRKKYDRHPAAAVKFFRNEECRRMDKIPELRIFSLREIIENTGRVLSILKNSGSKTRAAFFQFPATLRD